MLAKEKWQIRTIAVLEEVFAHRIEQNARYGPNTELEDGTGPDVHWLHPQYDAGTASDIEGDFRREYEEYEVEHGAPTWMHLVREEIGESFKESDPVRLRSELLQVAALSVKWIEAIDEREAVL